MYLIGFDVAEMIEIFSFCNHFGALKTNETESDAQHTGKKLRGTPPWELTSIHAALHRLIPALFLGFEMLQHQEDLRQLRLRLWVLV